MASTIYMDVLFGSYRCTTVPLEVSWYRGMTRKVHPYIKDEILWLLLYIWVYFSGHTAVPQYRWKYRGTAV